MGKQLQAMMEQVWWAVRHATMHADMYGLSVRVYPDGTVAVGGDDGIPEDEYYGRSPHGRTIWGCDHTLLDYMRELRDEAGNVDKINSAEGDDFWDGIEADLREWAKDNLVAA